METEEDETLVKYIARENTAIRTMKIDIGGYILLMQV